MRLVAEHEDAAVEAFVAKRIGNLEARLSGADDDDGVAHGPEGYREMRREYSVRHITVDGGGGGNASQFPASPPQAPERKK
jgi:hypothetical protein